MLKRFTTILVLALTAQLAFAPTAKAIFNYDNKAVTKEYIYWDNRVTADCPSATDLSGNSPTGTDSAAAAARKKVIWDFLTAPGRLTAPQAAGVLANMTVESAHTFDPTIVQGGTYKATPEGVNNGYGIVQWTPGTKLLKYADIAANPTLGGNLTRQLNVLWDQLTNASSPLPEKAAGDALKATTTAEQAAVAFMIGYERPADKSLDARDGRAALANPILVEMTGGTSGTITPLTTTNGTPVTTSSSCPSATSQASASIDTAHMFESSVSIQCAPGTTDAGVQDGYHNGIMVKIRVCAIPNFPCTNEECQELGNGHALVNSRASGAILKMITDAIAARDQAGKSYQINASSTFRTMAHQTALYNAPHSDPVAKPGFSNHQMGLAIDFGFWKNTNTGLYDWLKANASRYGYQQLPSEVWHWSTNGG